MKDKASTIIFIIITMAALIYIINSVAPYMITQMAIVRTQQQYNQNFMIIQRKLAQLEEYHSNKEITVSAPKPEINKK